MMSKSTKATRSSGPEGEGSADKEAEAISSMRYEEALEELESLVQRVEDGQLPLEEGVDAHRRAILLLRHCEGILDAAQARIEEISGSELGGEPESPA